MADKVKKLGEMRFCFNDWREIKFNESTDTTFALYGVEDEELMSLETYYLLCRQFAAAVGFSEKSIEERFGKY